MRNKLVGERLLLMGSKAFRAKVLPISLKRKIDEAITRGMQIIVGEVPGACRLFQDYLKGKKYNNVIVGHAKSIRYNAGGWKTKQFGLSVTEREKNMITECSSAIIIWHDKSGVIAENLEILRRSDKPTFIYEYYSATGKGKADWLDPARIYDPYHKWKEHMRNEKRRRLQESK